MTVSVEAGIVRLEGVVLEDATRQRAAEVAEDQAGVLWVENELVLDASLSRRLEPTWERLQTRGYDLVVRLPLLVVALMIVGFSLMVGRWLGRLDGPRRFTIRNPFLRHLIGRAIQAAVVLAGIIMALDLLEATALVGAVAGTAGLAGLAIGFAFKDIVENYLAGLLLAFQRPFEKNDHVLVDGHEGKIVRMTPRETILMTLEGNHVRVPNAVVFRSPLLNYSRNPRRRFTFDAGVGPSDDLALARKSGIEVLKEMKGVLDDPAPAALIVNLGDSSVTVRFMGWVDQREAAFGRVRSEAIRLVKLRLEAAGISLPSPEFLVRMTDDGPNRVLGSGDDAPTSGSAPSFEATDVRREQEDVSRDDSVDRQIEAERLESDEEDLLETPASSQSDSG